MKQPKSVALLLALLTATPCFAQTPNPPAADNEFAARERATAEGTRRMAPIPQDQWTQGQRDANAIYKAARKNDLRSGVFMDLLRVPEAMEAALQMRLYVQNQISFGEKLSQLGMLVTLRKWNQGQEWGGHAREAVRYGLDPRIVQAIAEGRHPEDMDADEALIFDFTSELLDNHNISDLTYGRMIKRFGERGVIEGITLATLYSMVGMTLNTVRDPIPNGYPPMPAFPQMAPIPLSAYADLPPLPKDMPPMPPPRAAAPPPAATK